MTDVDTSELALKQWCEKVAEMPMVAHNDPRVDEREQHAQFGNNFYLLWQGLQPGVDTDAPFYKIYAGRARELPQWNEFCENNPDLLDRISEALKVYEPWHELFSFTVSLFREKRFLDADRLDEATGHPLGISAISLFAWDELNSVLREAATKMEESGIDPAQFYG